MSPARRYRMPFVFHYLSAPIHFVFCPSLALCCCCCSELCTACSGAALPHCTQNQQFRQSRVSFSSPGWHKMAKPLLMTSSLLSHSLWTDARGGSGVTGRYTRTSAPSFPFIPSQKCLPLESPAASLRGGRLFVMTSF